LDSHILEDALGIALKAFSKLCIRILVRVVSYAGASRRPFGQPIRQRHECAQVGTDIQSAIKQTAETVRHQLSSFRYRQGALDTRGVVGILLQLRRSCVLLQVWHTGTKLRSSKLVFAR
jgi:hypothetical protein